MSSATINITRAMIQAVKDCQEFYAGEDDLTLYDICHAAMENDAFEKFWENYECECQEERFIKRLMKAVRS